MLESGTKVQALQQTKSEKLDELRGAVARMTKEVRQAVNVYRSSTGSRLDMLTYIDGALHQIVYDASGDTVTRTVDGGSAVPIASRVQNPTEMFTYAPASWSGNGPSMVAVSLTAKPSAAGSTALTLSTNVYLRNIG